MKWRRVRGGSNGAYVSFRGKAGGQPGRRAPFKLVSVVAPDGESTEWHIFVRGAWIGLRSSVQQAKSDCEEFYEVGGKWTPEAQRARDRKLARHLPDDEW